MPETPNPAPLPSDAALDEALPVGPGASFTFLYYFSTAAIITGLCAAKALGIGLTTGLTGEIALLGGGLGGGLGVLFNRSVTLTVPIVSKKKFQQQLDAVLTGMGYSLGATEGTIARYQKAKASRFFAGDIYVQQRDRTAVFISRASTIRTLKQRLNS
ncbi:MAG TPA: hypothetical protein V6D02_16485 [Candidatus Obscuribacterales bacterium]